MASVELKTASIFDEIFLEKIPLLFLSFASCVAILLASGDAHESEFDSRIYELTASAAD